MLYKTSEQKELFKFLVPDIHKIKELFEIAGAEGSKEESRIINALNNEIQMVLDGRKDNRNRLRNNSYKMLTVKIKNKTLRNKVEKYIEGILSKINRFESEYRSEI